MNKRGLFLQGLSGNRQKLPLNNGGCGSETLWDPSRTEGPEEGGDTSAWGAGGGTVPDSGAVYPGESIPVRQESVSGDGGLWQRPSALSDVNTACFIVVSFPD